MPNLPEPVKVSPLIKVIYFFNTNATSINAFWQFLRYSFLIAGIIYGASKLKALRILEESKKEERELRKQEKLARIAEERRAASERDIAQIVAIFTGKSEVDSEVTESNSPQSAKLEQEDQKPKVDVEKKFSDDLKTCKMEVAKQSVQDDKSVFNPSVNSEFGSDQSRTSVLITDKDSTDTCDSDNADIFSGVFNLNTPKHKKYYTRKRLNKPEERDGYYVETFEDQIPYAEQEASTEDFFKKDNKK